MPKSNLDRVHMFGMNEQVADHQTLTANPRNEPADELAPFPDLNHNVRRTRHLKVAPASVTRIPENEKTIVVSDPFKQKIPFVGDRSDETKLDSAGETLPTR